MGQHVPLGLQLADAAEVSFNVQEMTGREVTLLEATAERARESAPPFNSFLDGCLLNYLMGKGGTVLIKARQAYVRT